MQRVLRPPRSRRAAAAPSSRAWLAVLVLALAIRVACLWLAGGREVAPDAARIGSIAHHLARGAGFATDGPAGPRATASVAPLLPWLAGLAERAFGDRPLLPRLLGCVTGALVPLILAGLGGALFGLTVGRLGAWLAALSPVLVFFSGFVSPETCFGAAVLLALLVSVEWVKTPRHPRAFGAGIAWGVASLAGAAALPLPLLVAAWAWEPLGLTVGAAMRARQLALLAGGLLLIVAPWTLRNAVVTRSLVPVSTGVGAALRQANDARVWDDPALRGGPGGAFPEPAPWISAVPPVADAPAEAAADRRAAAEAWTFARSRSKDWPAVAAARLAHFWRITWPARGAGAGARSGPERLLDPLLLWSLPAVPLALWGAARALRGSRRAFQLLPLLVALYFTARSIVLPGALSARVPVEPVLVLFAALGLDDVRRRLRARARGLTLMAPRAAAGGGD